MKKKSQIQMMETIAVLLIFFIIVIIALVFYMNIAKSQISDQLDQSHQRDRASIAQKASTLPELECMRTTYQNCIDIYKIAPAQDLMQQNAIEYFDLFAYSEITIYKIYPEPVENWTIYEKLPSTIKSTLANQFPILLYDPITDSNYFGLMEVKVFK
jgi:hypothetical protein